MATEGCNGHSTRGAAAETARRAVQNSDWPIATAQAASVCTPSERAFGPSARAGTFLLGRDPRPVRVERRDASVIDALPSSIEMLA